MSQHTTESGNVLFLILIAVALFAALSYAVTQTSGSGSSFSKEDAETEATKLLNFLSDVQSNVNYMLTIEGVPQVQLDFRYEVDFCNGATSTLYTNSSCTSTRCQVFHPDGGGSPMKYFADLSYTCEELGIDGTGNLVPGFLEPQIVKIEEVGSDANEIVLSISRVRIEVCAAFNRLLGISENPDHSVVGETKYGYHADGPVDDLDAGDARTFGDDSDDLDGQYAFCRQTTSSGYPIGEVYYTIVAR